MANFYVDVFADAQIDFTVKPDPDRPTVVVGLRLYGLTYALLNGDPDFVSTHSFSISVLTEDQAETDRFWTALLDGGGEGGRCGWLKDRYGGHWQIIPTALPDLMGRGGEAGIRVQAALMEMNKIDIAALEAAAKR